MPAVDPAVARVSNDPMLTARLFGGLRVEVDGREVPPLAGLRPRSLLAFLLLNPVPHPRARLAGRFWPDVLDTSARASLRSALWAVREALDAVEGGAYLRADRTHVGIDPDLPREVDVERFDRLLSDGGAAALEEAVSIARGPLLSDLADEWVLDEQDRHRDRLVGALERLAAEAEQCGDGAAAVRWTRIALSHDRLRETSHRDLMRRLDAVGERAQALAQYGRLRSALANEMGIRPSDETRALAASLRAGAAVPAPQAPSARRPASAELRAGTMVGRPGERADLRRAWERAASGDGGVCVVTGPAGLGKTRLLDDLADAARAGGGRVALGGALDLDGAPPLAPWSEALRGLIRGVAPPPAAAWTADFARICPSAEILWGRAARDPSSAPDLERMRVFDAVVEAIAWCAGAAPVLVGLEDLHRVDPASAALLAHLGRRLTGVQALIVVTRRPGPPAPELDAARAAIRGRGMIHAEIALDPLTDADLARIVDDAAPDLEPGAARDVVEAASGNPLLAREAARSAAAGRPPAEGLRASLRAPLAGLPPPARRLVDLTAAAGRPLRLGEAADLMEEGDLATALEDGVASGLLDPSDERRVAFTHDLVREACYAELGPVRAVEAHRRLAAVLGRRPGRRAAEVARHHRLAGDPEAAQRYLSEAAQDARALGALDDAASYLTEAAGLSGHDPGRSAELWLALAEVHAWRADRAGMDEAFATAERLIAGAGDEAGLALAHAFRARWLHTTLCYPADALAAARRALELIGLGGVAAPEARLLALASAAWAESVAGDPAEVPRIAAIARSIPEAMGDRALESELEHARGTALLRAGEFGRAGEVCERAADLARLAGRPDVAALCLLTAASAAACGGDVARVTVLADRLAGWAWPGVSLDLQMRAARAHALSRLGREAEAIAAARENLSVASRDGSPGDEALAELDLGVVLLASGSGADAAAHLGAALAAGATGIPRALARLQLSEALLVSGDPEAADRELGRVPFEPVGAADMPEALVPRIARLQGLVAAARGEPGLAARRLDEAEDAWRRLAAARPGGEAYTAVLVDLGRPPVAGLVEPERELSRLAAERAGAPTVPGAGR